MSISKGDLLTEQQLDDAVHQLVVQAMELGMVPIAGIMSEKLPDGMHRVVGFGWNRLREGIPGIHGETGAIMSMGRLPQGYAQLTATSSLSPCPFCQASLALHLGIREIRILDATNYRPDFSGYAKVGLSPRVSEHPGIVEAFGRWVRDPSNAMIWNRDIGEWTGISAHPFDATTMHDRAMALMEIAHRMARRAEQAGEAPIGAVIADRFGEAIGIGASRIVADNDPCAVAAMCAWRACGARDHWKDKTLLLTAGPDHIAHSMFHVFRFGQLIVASDRVVAGQLEAVRGMDVAVDVLGDPRSDGLLRNWIARSDRMRIGEYLGARFTA